MKKSVVALTAIVALLMSLLVSCQKTGSEQSQSGGDGSKVGASTELNVFNWEAYMPEEVLEAFTKETGIAVNYEEYDSNETMITKITAGSSYDIAFPTQDFVPALVQEGLVQKLDLSKLPNLSNIDTWVVEATQSFDPGNQYSVPYNIGSIGIMYWKEKVANPGNSVEILSRPELKGKTLILDDTREVFSAALRSLGFSVNTVAPKEIAAATKLILKWKEIALKFDISQMPTLFGNKDVWVALGYPENVLSEMEADKRQGVGFFLLKDGNARYLDNMVILKDAKNVENAYKFINFIYRPENLAKIADLYGYPGVSAKAAPLRQSKPFYAAEDISSFEFRKALGSALDLYTKAWEDEIKIGQ